MNRIKELADEPSQALAQGTPGRRAYRVAGLLLVGVAAVLVGVILFGYLDARRAQEVEDWETCAAEIHEAEGYGELSAAYFRDPGAEQARERLDAIDNRVERECGNP